MGRAGTHGANKEGDRFQLSIQNREVTRRSGGPPGEEAGSPSLQVFKRSWAGRVGGIVPEELR